MDEELVICGYCTKNATFDSIIQHLFDEHSFRQVKYRERFLCDKTGTTMLLSKLIQVIPDSISQESINIDSFARTITVKHTPSKSPAPTKLYSDQTSKS